MRTFLTIDEIRIVENDSMFHNTRIICPICAYNFYEKSFKNHFEIEHHKHIADYSWSIVNKNIEIDEIFNSITVTINLSYNKKIDDVISTPESLIEDYYNSLALNYEKSVISTKENVTNPNNVLDNENVAVPKNSEKLLQITDLDILEIIKQDITSNRILSAAQKIGNLYENQYPHMELRDWIRLVKNCSF